MIPQVNIIGGKGSAVIVKGAVYLGGEGGWSPLRKIFRL